MDVDFTLVMDGFDFTLWWFSNAWLKIRELMFISGFKPVPVG
jgi:hypothetical protein